MTSNNNMFSDNELKGIVGVTVKNNYVEVICGCTSHKYGDYVGMLRIFRDGSLLINCHCSPDCSLENMTPNAFEKHSQKQAAPRWKRNVWVHLDGKKVGLGNTALVKFYDRTNARRKRQVFHRDEFLVCTLCYKLRRVKMSSKTNCQYYHMASQDPDWECADMQLKQPDDRLAKPEEMPILTCMDEEERDNRIVCRGCPKDMQCTGCKSCVCTGCKMCLVENCKCQQCKDFYSNFTG